MKCRVVHSTEYRYGDPVPLCHNVIRMRPRDTALQTCLETALTIAPLPAVRRDRTDYFGNHATWVSLQEPHTALQIEAVSVVEVRPPPAPAESAGVTWEQAVERLARSDTPAVRALREMAFASPQVPVDPQLADYARPSFGAGRSLLQCALDLTQRIHREFTFDTRATTVGTPVAEVLRNRRGVCQDFAHLQIGCLRSLGLPARYVSGYLLTKPPPGQRRLVGCDASHAWLAAFVPDVGWVDFDPTNGLMPSAGHVTVAWGRDYDDVSPVKGVLVGGHRHTMYYGVDVEPLDPEEPPGTELPVPHAPA
jgi:transglutaminase-like putative cysteine protease